MPLRSLLKDHAIVALVVGAGLATSLLRDRVTVSTFGVEVGFDGFLVAFTVVTFAVQVPAGALGAALVPKLAGPNGGEVLQAALGTVVVLGTIGAVSVGVLAGTLSPLLVEAPTQQDWAEGALRGLAVIVPFVLANVVLGAALQVKERAAAGASAIVVRHLSFVLALALALERLSPLSALLTSTVIGLLAEFSFLVVLVKRAGIAIGLSFGTSANLGTLWSESRWLMLNGVALGSTSVVDQSMAARLGEGSVSALVYGARPASALLAVATIAIGSVLLPRLAKLVLHVDRAPFFGLATGYVVSLSIVGTVAAAAGWVGSSGIHDILYGPAAFHPSQRMLAISCQEANWWLVPSYVVVSVNARVLIALGKSRLLVLFGVLIAILNVPMNLVLGEVWGAAGIAWSTVFAYAIAAALGLLVIIRIRREES